MPAADRLPQRGMTGTLMSSMQPIFSSQDPADAVATAIEQWGVVQLRDAVPLRRAVALSADAVDYFLVRKLTHGGGSILCAVPGAALGQEVEINVAILECVCAGPAGAAARSYFRRVCGTDEFIVPWKGLHVRPFAPGYDPRMLPFHQDAYAFPTGWVMVNGWTLLYPAATGEDAAGLEFIPARVTQLIEREKNSTHPTQAWMELSHADIAALSERYGTWVPKIELGDVMLFHQLAPHRTHCGPFATKPRLAVEVRMIAKTEAVLMEYGRNGIPYFTITPDGVVGPKRARIGEKIEALRDAPV
jgi:hypothetical protein